MCPDTTLPEKQLGPTSAHKPLRDIADLFEPRIFARALAYYREGNVLEFAEIAPDLWHGVVAGAVDYDVDVRIHAGRILSAACSCPYAQEHTYCKHVGALLLAINHDLANTDGDKQPSTPMLSASHAVTWYWAQVMGTRVFHKGAPTNDDWQAIRTCFEHLYGFPNITDYVKKVLLDRVTGHDNRYQSQLHTSAPETFNDLPHGWLTILEASYEYLDDDEGLRRLYSLYILLATNKQDAVYVQLLRDLAGEHWHDDVEFIVAIARELRYRLSRNDNPAYERLLREENLVDAAYDYIAWHLTDDRMLRFLPLLVQKEPNRLLTRIVKHMRQPEIDLYQGDLRTSANCVYAWVRAIDRYFGEQAARDITHWILDMFPTRDLLHARLEEYTDDNI